MTSVLDHTVNDRAVILSFPGTTPPLDPDPYAPCTAFPGSEQRIRVLEARAALSLPLFHAGDNIRRPNTETERPRERQAERSQRRHHPRAQSRWVRLPRACADRRHPPRFRPVQLAATGTARARRRAAWRDRAAGWGNTAASAGGVNLMEPKNWIRFDHKPDHKHNGDRVLTRCTLCAYPERVAAS